MLTALFTAALVCLPARGDSPIDPYPYITHIHSGTYYFKMIPGPGIWDTDNAKGGFYKVSKGEDELLWETKGWYSFQVFLANDLKHMVRMGMWATGRWPSTNELAVAFYRSGKLVKSYSTHDLVPDPKDVRLSVSHYQWYTQIHGLEELEPDDPFGPLETPKHKLTFSLTTTANERIIFDVQTGEIVSRSKKDEDTQPRPEPYR